MTDTSAQPAPLRPAEDPSILQRACSGDRAAQAKLYSDTLGDVCAVFAAALRLPAGHLDVRSAAADVFADLCERDAATKRTGWERYEPPPEGLPFRAFVRMVAHRRVARLLRDRGTRRRKHAEVDPLLRERGIVHQERRLEAAAEVRAVWRASSRPTRGRSPSSTWAASGSPTPSRSSASAPTAPSTRSSAARARRPGGSARRSSLRPAPRSEALGASGSRRP